MSNALPAWKADFRSRLAKLCDKQGRVSESLAVELIEGSVWWETHPSGPVQAPGFAKHIYGALGEWKITFGANTFLISRAVHGCCKVIENWLPKQSGPIAQLGWATLQNEFNSVLRGSVSNYIGEIYQRYTGGSKEKMVFGSQSISVNCFTRVLARALNSPELGAFTRTPPLAVRQRGVATTVATTTGNTSCPWCGHSVKTVNLAKHLRKKCPNRPDNLKDAEIATSNTVQDGIISPKRPPGRELVFCPQCGIKIRKPRLAEHLAKKCPKRPL